MSGTTGDDRAAAEVASQIAELRRRRATGAVVAPAGSAAAQPSRACREIGIAAREIERLQALRVRRVRDASIGEVVARTREHASSVQRRFGRLIDAWEAVLPGELTGRTAITALRGGVAHVVAESSPVAYEVNRVLREGALASLLRARTGAAVARVKVTVGRGSAGGATPAAARGHVPPRNSGSA